MNHLLRPRIWPPFSPSCRLYEPEAWRPRMSTPATYRSGTPRDQHPAIALWHDHLRGLATAIHETSGLVMDRRDRRNLLSHWKLCHNSPNPSFRTSAASRGEIRNPLKNQFNQVLYGSQLASALSGLGRDDELRPSLLSREGTYSYPAELI